eukprot:scaffold54060_cov32-Cyclotella_meneghiniana.AAC.1
MMSMIRQSHFTILTARRIWHHYAVEEKEMLSYKTREHAPMRPDVEVSPLKLETNLSHLMNGPNEYLPRLQGSGFTGGIVDLRHGAHKRHSIVYPSLDLAGNTSNK